MRAEFNFFSQRNFFTENWQNFSAHEQTVFREKHFAFRKDFSQWKSGLMQIKASEVKLGLFKCLSSKKKDGL